MPPQLFVGTSGYSYKEWKGSFYPEDLSAKRFLTYYAQHFPTVEINNTFYRMPKADVLERWRSEVSAGFRFVLKAPQAITHRARLSTESYAATKYFIETAAALADSLGPLLFQLPPFLRADASRLEAFLAQLPQPTRTAFEFRHDSWLDAAVTRLLEKTGTALCLSDQDEHDPPELIPTTTWGYLRLRRVQYPDAVLRSWVKKLRQQTWKEVYVFFKHEDAGTGPRLATRFRELYEA